ncbi:hypothetical protein ENBRE01_1506 [Enteropsectra breve]|nr:hypothetical protein ENBRE01_1506 [Enteropsectra breve]
MLSLLFMILEIESRKENMDHDVGLSNGNKCLPGSVECENNTIKMCDINNQWVYVDCPSDKSCDITGGAFKCIGAKMNSKDNSKDNPKDNSKDNHRDDSEQDSDDRNNRNNNRNNNNRNNNDRNNNDNDNNNNNDNDNDRNAKKRTITVTKNLRARDSHVTTTGNEDKRNNRENEITKFSTIEKTVTITQQATPKEIKLEYTLPDSVHKTVTPTQSTGSSPTGATSSSPAGASPSSGGASPSSGGASPSSGGTSTSPGGSSAPSSVGGQGPSAGGDSASPVDSSSPSGGSTSPSTGGSSSSPSSAPSALSSPGSDSSSPSSSPTSSSPSDGGSSASPSASSPSSDKSNAGSDKSNASSDKSSTLKQDNNSSSGGGGQFITRPQLEAVMKANNFSPKPEFMDAMISVTNQKFKDKEMAAMFLAQCAHESGGFQYIEEIACAKPGGCPGQYGTGAPGKDYHGRGFIQLSWSDNYKKASQALGMGTKLYDDPDQVAKDPKLGALVSVWFWTANVQDQPGVKDKTKFGASTKAINGKLECNGQNVSKSKDRYKIYQSFVKEMNISKPASESGCYN